MSQGFSQLAPRERRAVFRRALVDSLPVLMGYVTMGFAAGVLMARAGNVPCPWLWAGFVGFSCVSGTLSFAIVPAVAQSLGLWQVALLTLGINFRYAFYGISMLGRWRGVPLVQKWFLVHSLSDEIYALDVACRYRDPVRNRLYCLWNHALNVGYWTVAAALGGLAGSELPIPSEGVEFAMVALFLVIFTDQMKGLAKRHG